jgi:hypothetical protein
MKIVYDNCSIECISAEIISRQIIPSSYLEINNIGKCLTYKCKRNSEASILKELIPKEAKVNQNSYLDISSKVECESLFVAVCKNKPYKLDVINHSGRHKAQYMKTDEFTFAKISKQLNNIPQANPEIEFLPVTIEIQ